MRVATIIGENIRKARQQKDVKQEALAKYLGISKSRLSQIENGCCNELSIARLEKIADYLKIDCFLLLAPQKLNTDTPAELAKSVVMEIMKSMFTD